MASERGTAEKFGVNFQGSDKKGLKIEIAKTSACHPKNNTNLTVQKSRVFSRKGRSM